MKTVAGYLGRGLECPACGKRHEIRTREVLLADDAVARLPGLVSGLGLSRRALVLADVRTQRAAGAAVAAAFRAQEWACDEVVLADPPGGGEPICDDLTRAALQERLPADGLIVAVGSGVVNDLAKWIAADTDRPYVVVPTAASMNGYTSANIAPMVRGVKCLLPGREPVVVATSHAILCSAPAAMTAAGLGDVLAKSVSTADWMVNRVLFGEYYCPLCAGLIREIEPVYMEAPEAIAAARRDGIEALFEAIVLTGFSMTMAGTSAPASGGEHLISHTLDMMALRDGARHDLHGRQVGVATIFCAALYAETFRQPPPLFRDGSTRTDPAFWQRFTEVVEEKHAGKRRRQEQAAERLRQRPELWETLREAVAPLCTPPEALREVLRRAGAAYRLADIGVSRQRFIEAVLHGHEVRERFTVLDLARCAGVLPARAEVLVDRWLVR